MADAHDPRRDWRKTYPLLSGQLAQGVRDSRATFLGAMDRLAAGMARIFRQTLREAGLDDADV